VNDVTFAALRAHTLPSDHLQRAANWRSFSVLGGDRQPPICDIVTPETFRDPSR
jgi:hypothetical protein